MSSLIKQGEAYIRDNRVKKDLVIYHVIFLFNFRDKQRRRSFGRPGGVVGDRDRCCRYNHCVAKVGIFSKYPLRDV